MAFSDYNFGGLKSRVNFRLQEHPKYADKLGVAVNKAVERMMLKFKNVEKVYETDTYILTEGEYAGKYAMEYPLPDWVLYVDTVSWNGYKMDPMSLGEWVETRAEQSDYTDDPQRYMIRDDGSQKILCVYPRPSRTVRLQFYGVLTPTTMSDDTDVPPFKSVFADALEYYACHYLLEGQEGEDTKAERMRQLADQAFNDARKEHTADRIYKTNRTR